MNMYYLVGKSFKLEIGHKLLKHQGKCKNLHGHSLKLEVNIASDSLNENDMVMDFSDLKDIMSDLVEEWDHSILLNLHDTELIDFCEKTGSKYVAFDQDPTSEVIAKTIYDFLSEGIKNLGKEIEAFEVVVHETENSVASYGK